MPGMQIPIVGTKASRRPLAAPATHALAHGGNRGDGLHCLEAVFGGGIRPASRRARSVASASRFVARALHEIAHEARLAPGSDVQHVVSDEDLTVGIGTGTDAMTGTSRG